MRIKKFLPVLILTVILASCVSAPTQASTVTVTSKVTVTSVPTMLLPTEMPTIDPTVPIEYSRFENGDYFLDKTTENGNALTYTWDEERKVWERQIFYGPVWQLDKQTSDEIKQQTNNKSDGNQLPMTVFVDHTIDGENLLPILIYHENVDPKNTINWSGHFLDTMVAAMKNKGVQASEVFEFQKWFLAHEYRFDFMNSDGSQQWGLWDGSSITVQIRGDYEQLKKDMEANGFSEAKSLHGYGPENTYMVKIWTEDGNLFVDIAPSLRPATEWTEKQIMEMFMFGPAAVMEQSPNLTNPQSAGLLSEFVLNQKSFRLFDIEPLQ